MRKRIERLELATRFRPLHIAMLVVDAAPPARSADFFYAGERSDGRPDSTRRNDEALYSLAGVSTGNASKDPQPLGEFQRAGFCVTSVAECPLGEHLDTGWLNRELGRTFVLRVRHSYKPRFILPISDAVSGVLPSLSEAGYAGQILLGTDGQIFTPFRETGESIRAMADRISALLAGKKG
jgi:hypothetical protein